MRDKRSGVRRAGKTAVTASEREKLRRDGTDGGKPPETRAPAGITR
jgi:hypothetical protein